MRLQDKVAVITGAAAGIGKAMALRFVEEGARVVLADLNEDKLTKVADSITAAGGACERVVTDVTDLDQVQAMIARATDTWGRLDILVNNAGVLDGLTPPHDTSPELWHKVMAVNATGPFYACRLVIPIMLEQESGAIVNVTSSAAIRGGRGGAAYTASKHAVLGLTRNIAWYYAKQGIRANAIAPGAIKTGMAAGGGAAPPHRGGIDALKPYFMAIPPRGATREVADCALFLASDEASYVNGALLTADAGWTAY